MTQPRRSLRHIATSPDCKNIFIKNNHNEELIRLIPPSVYKQVGYHSFITCEFIQNLPPFTMTNDLESEIQGVRLAANHQLEWQSSFIPADYQHQLMQDEQVQYQNGWDNEEKWQRSRWDRQQRRKHKERNIWSDPYFLQRLNDFIMGKFDSVKSLTEPSQLLQN